MPGCSALHGLTYWGMPRCSALHRDGLTYWGMPRCFVALQLHVLLGITSSHKCLTLPDAHHGAHLDATYVFLVGIPTTVIAGDAFPWLNNLPVFELAATKTALAGWATPGGPGTSHKVALVRGSSNYGSSSFFRAK